MVTMVRQSIGLALRVVLPAMILVLVLAACGDGTGVPGLPVLDRDKASDIAWEALEPNTASHDRANWAVVEKRRASGRSVAEEFEGWGFDGSCWGPAPPPNGEIEPAETYWYVKMQPQPATPNRPTISPTAPPSVPEPFMAWAIFLIDDNGQVIARVLACVIY
jgi:hypothetical protein